MLHSKNMDSEQHKLRLIKPLFMKTKLLVLITIFFTLLSCDVVRQKSQSLYNVANCDYNFNNIEDVSIGGINLSNGLSLSNIPRVTSMLSGSASTIPLDFLIGLDVKNNADTPALLAGLDYTVFIDDVKFTNGYMDQSMEIAGGATKPIALSVGVDLKTLLSGDMKDAVSESVKNIVGLGSSKSNFKVELRPSFNVKGTKVTSPIAIPLSFSYGGKK